MKRTALKCILNPLMLSFCAFGFSMQTAIANAEANEPPLIDLGAELESMKGGGEKSKKHSMPAEAPKTPKAMERETREERVDKGGNVITSRSTASNQSKHKHADWRYSDKEGPRYWGELSPEYKQCKAGKNQSPINLKDKTALSTAGLPGLDIYYRDVPLKVINTGHTLKINYPLGSYIKLGTARYELLQFHFHTPSEHQKDGFNYPMEVHLVHRDGEGNYAVLGVIFQEGEENPALNILLKNLPKKVGKQEIHRRASLNPAKFLPGNTEFYKYSGSLTTPPCSEGVLWMVFKQPIDASAEQINKLNEIMGNNARPIQPNYARSLLKSWLEPTQQQEVLPYEFY
ncbi:Carbonic anhydrase, alpha class [hydrothermal vent metagenome]|uniref:carbonic anhydrase n=1 Tax=hydrothermal vent metagenome TaxID=652676 RepID=A0A3B0WPM5_9ZZZZ